MTAFPSFPQNYPYCSSGLGWLDSDLELAVAADTRHLVAAGAVVDDDDAQWETEPGTPLDEVTGLLSLSSPASPDSACGGDELPDPQTEEEEEQWVTSALPPHPRSPSPARQRTDSDVEVIEVIAAPRSRKRRLSCQRRLDFGAGPLPPKKQRRFLQAGGDRRVVVQTALPPLPPFSSLQTTPELH